MGFSLKGEIFKNSSTEIFSVLHTMHSLLPNENQEVAVEVEEDVHPSWQAQS